MALPKWLPALTGDGAGTIGYLLEDAYTMLTGDSDPAAGPVPPTVSGGAKERQRRETVLFPGGGAAARLHGHG